MIQVRAGQIIGRDHMARQANAQDSVAVTQQNGYVVGVVCDGCGSGTSSEVGAKLAAQYIVMQAKSRLDAEMLPEDVVKALYPSVINFLNYLLIGMQPINEVDFIHHHLLFTIVGVIASDEQTLVFSAGDGLIAIDDTVTQINQNNTPAYIAYNLLDANALNSLKMPDSFEVCDVPEWNRIAVATDGFEPELLPAVWGMSHQRGLQRKLNVWSNMERRFRDDAAIITLEKVQAQQ